MSKKPVFQPDPLYRNSIRIDASDIKNVSIWDLPGRLHAMARVYDPLVLIAQIKIDIEQDYDYVEYSLRWSRPKTDDELAKERERWEQIHNADKVRAKAAKAAKDEADRKVYERLKKKFEKA